MTDDYTPAPAKIAVLIASSTAQVWGMSSQERLGRQLARAGVTDVRTSTDGIAAEAGVVILRLDWAYEQRLIDELVARPNVMLAGGATPVAAHVTGAQTGAAVAALSGGPALPGVATLDSEGLAGSYNRKLRKREIAYLIPLTDQTAADVEARSFAGSYKGVTDLVTKYVWPRPARVVTKWCAVRGITPNQVTLVGLVLVFAAFWAFWNGHYLSGLVAAWIMTFLDTVDGKLARVTMTASKFGDVMDHGIDLVHPPFWWWAWVVGLPASGHPVAGAGAGAGVMIAIIFGGYIAQRLEEGAFMRLFGMHMHVWRPFDSFFRLITARRNPNLIVLTVAALLGAPDWGMIVVCGWIVICFFVHLSQIVQAMLIRRHGAVTSWLSA